MRAVFAAASSVSPSQPATHGLPIPRATTAACEVIPPWAVRIPCAKIIPLMSSGVVSQRTRITLSPARPLSSAVSASKTIAPTAAPGDAFSPLAATSSDALGSIIGWSSWSSWAGSMRDDRLLAGDQPLVDHVHRGLQRGGRGPLRRAGLEQVERPLLDRELHVLHVAVVLLEPLDRLDVLVERLREDVRHPRERLRRADPGDDILALRVDQELAEHARLARGRVARERDAGRRALALGFRRPSGRRSPRCRGRRGSRARGGRPARAASPTTGRLPRPRG